MYKYFSLSKPKHSFYIRTSRLYITDIYHQKLLANDISLEECENKISKAIKYCDRTILKHMKKEIIMYSKEELVSMIDKIIKGECNYA